MGEIIPHLIALSYVPATGATWLDIHRVHLMALLLPIWWPLVFGSRKWQQLSKILPWKKKQQTNKKHKTNKQKETEKKAGSPKLQGKSDRTLSELQRNTPKQMTAFPTVVICLQYVWQQKHRRNLKRKENQIKHNVTFTLLFEVKKEESP